MLLYCKIKQYKNDADGNSKTDYAKSADETGYKEPLAEHTIHDIQAGRRLIANLPFSNLKKRRIAHDLTEAIAFHDIGKAATGFQVSLDTRKPWGYRHEILSQRLPPLQELVMQ